MYKLMVYSKDKFVEDVENKFEFRFSFLVVVGFYDFGFMDFFVKKFLLVVKVYCEDNVRILVVFIIIFSVASVLKYFYFE